MPEWCYRMFSGISLLWLSLIWEKCYFYIKQSMTAQTGSLLTPLRSTRGCGYGYSAGFARHSEGHGHSSLKMQRKLSLMQQLLLEGLFFSRESPATRTDPIFACAHIKGVKVWIMCEPSSSSVCIWGEKVNLRQVSIMIKVTPGSLAFLPLYLVIMSGRMCRESNGTQATLPITLTLQPPSVRLPHGKANSQIAFVNLTGPRSATWLSHFLIFCNASLRCLGSLTVWPSDTWQPRARRLATFRTQDQV